MFFGSWTALWFSLSVPLIILMYMWKKTYVDTTVSSHLLWNKVLRELEANRPWQKLQSRLLLWLQLLAAIALVLALMEPYIWSKVQAKEHVIIVLDRSASMGTLENGQASDRDERLRQTRLDVAKQQLLSWLNEHAAGSYITLLLMGREPEVVVSREKSITSIKQQLEQVELDYGRTAYREAMSLAGALASQQTESEIRVFTDSYWTEATNDLIIDAPVTVIDTSSEERANVAITQFGVRALDGDHQAVIGLRNDNEQSVSFQLSLYDERELLAVRSVALQAGEIQSHYFDNLSESSVYRASIDVRDQYRADNDAFAFPDGNQPISVAFISQGNVFLEKALSLLDVQLIKPQWQDNQMTLPERPIDIVIVDSISKEQFESESVQQLLTHNQAWILHSPGEDEMVPITAQYEVMQHAVTRYVQLQDVHIASAKQADMTSAAGHAIVRADNVALIQVQEESGIRRVQFNFDLHQSDLPLRAEFPILVRNTIEWLSVQRAGHIGQHIAGDSVEMNLLPETASALWEKRNMALLTEVEWSKPLQTKDGQLTLVQAMPAEPGLYDLVEKDAQGNVIQRSYALVAGNPQESDGVKQTLSFARVNDDNAEAQAVSERTGEAPYSLISFILIGLIGLVLLEWGVYQRGHSV